MAEYTSAVPSGVQSTPPYVCPAYSTTFRGLRPSGEEPQRVRAGPFYRFDGVSSETGDHEAISAWDLAQAESLR